ncbi:MAG: ABC transporter permease [Myxococcales bacterium]|nr:ABC transporter permease [Myxococcales bacterium]MCB9520622.1 ABC transporter permease [Myxococcales bacterium]MCB9534246.1 ABC transporter permease [Myxococcales bacterium]
MFDSFRAIAWKEALHVRRDPATRFVFVIPVMQLLLFGFAIHLDVENVPTAWVDLDRTAESRALVASFRNTRTLALTSELSSLDEVERALQAHDVAAGVVIPHGYARSLLRGETSDVLMLVDGSNSTEATAASSTATALGATTTLRRFETLGASELQRRGPGRIDVRPRMLFNPELRSPAFFVPGLIGVIMQLITILLTSFAIVRERETGTYEQLMVTPVGPWALLLGKIAPYAVISAFETVLVVVLMVTVFQVPIAGSLLVLATLSLLFLVTALSLGVIISTLASTQMEAMQLSFLVLLPTILLSGFVFPTESIPEPIRTLTHIIPARYYIAILRGVILRGAPLSALIPDAVSLAVFTTVLLGIGVTRFRHRLS